jgi:restriction system protein
MARRRRNEKSLPELAFGFFMFVVVFAVFNPKARQQIFAALANVIAVFVLIVIAGLIIYLIIQSRKSKDAPVPTAIRRSPTGVPPPRVSDASNIPPDYSFVAEKEPSVPDVGLSTFESCEELCGRPKPVHARCWDVSVLKIIEWKRFETVCTEYLKMAGYVARETNTGADGGVDIRVSKPGNESFKGIVQCKAWNAYKVGVKPIRELFGIMAAERISTGVFITSGGFTSEAEEFAKGKILLVWGEKFISLIEKLQVDDRKKLLDIALEGDYTTPTCPQCNIKMALRESTKGRNTGGHFWGCVKFPRCKQTLIYREV